MQVPLQIEHTLRIMRIIPASSHRVAPAFIIPYSFRSGVHRSSRTPPSPYLEQSIFRKKKSSVRLSSLYTSLEFRFLRCNTKNLIDRKRIDLDLLNLT